MRSQSLSYDVLRDYIENIPLVDCHDHSIECGPKYVDVIQTLVEGYFYSDIQSASSDADAAKMINANLPLEERWDVFEKAWKRTQYTGYAQVTRRMLKKFYGENDLTLDALKRMQTRLLDLSDRKTYEDILEEAKIVVRLEDIWPDQKKVLDGTLVLSPRGKIVISLPGLHAIRDANMVAVTGAIIGKTITSLGEYLDVCREIFKGYKKFGAVAFKDQSAYNRPIDYGNPTYAQAEEVFNWFMEDPRRSTSYPDGNKPLGDFLFHEFMRMARDLDLPVQIHTGHMAGIRNEISKTNAIGLTRVLELHRDVRFDLFHANWPYSGELLYLGKNYPNVAIDFCWANIVDPIYCQEMFKQILSSVPHGKIHGYGSDYGGAVDKAWAHAQIARDNIAMALADMVQIEYIDVDEAKEIAYAWLFGNANEFFRLGM
jgi:uncharacterized protein